MGTLSLKFTGLCAFVPNHETEAKRARVLLVNASGGHVPHYPVLVFFKDSWQGGRAPDGYFDDPDGNEMAFCRLNGQDIWLLDVRDKNLHVVGQGTYSGCPDEGEKFKHFAWVGMMHRINRPKDAPSSPVWGDVEEQCLEAANVPRSVTARVELTDGTLASYAHTLDDEEAIVKWRFQRDPFDDPIDHIQSLAEEVELLLSQGGNTVSFGFRVGISGRNPRPLEPLQLTLGNELQVWIANMPWEQIVGRSYDEALLKSRRDAERKMRVSLNLLRAKGGKRDPDYHFAHFYPLLSGPKNNRIPFPESERCPNAGQPSVDNPKCPPVQLSANLKA